MEGMMMMRCGCFRRSRVCRKSNVGAKNELWSIAGSRVVESADVEFAEVELQELDGEEQGQTTEYVARDDELSTPRIPSAWPPQSTASKATSRFLVRDRLALK